FGIAKLRSSARSATLAVGTPGYMAPEQTQSSDDIGPPADIWPLGLMVFRMLTGSWFWRASAEDNSLSSLWREMLIDPLPRASERAAEFGLAHLLPPGFDDWFAQCVERDPRARFRHARAAGKALASILAAAGVRELQLLDSAKLLVSTPTPAPANLGTTLETIDADEVAEVDSLHTLTSVVLTNHRVTFREEGERVVALGKDGDLLLDVSLDAGIAHF